MSDKDKSSGMLASLMADMPPFAKTIMMLLLVLPMVATISAILLNVNVGANIERYIDHTYKLAEKEQITFISINKSLQQRDKALKGQLNAINVKLSSAIVNYGIMERKIKSNEDSIFKLEQQVRTIAESLLGVQAISPEKLAKLQSDFVVLLSEYCNHSDGAKASEFCGDK